MISDDQNIQRTGPNESKNIVRKSSDVSSRQYSVSEKFKRDQHILTSKQFFFKTIVYLIQVHTSPVTITTERAVTQEHNDYFGFEYVGKEYDEADMNTGNKTFFIETSRAIFDEIEKERSARDSKIDLFFHDNDSDSVLNFSHFSSNSDY